MSESRVPPSSWSPPAPPMSTSSSVPPLSTSFPAPPRGYHRRRLRSADRFRQGPRACSLRCCRTSRRCRGWTRWHSRSKPRCRPSRRRLLQFGFGDRLSRRQQRRCSRQCRFLVARGVDRPGRARPGDRCRRPLPGRSRLRPFNTSSPPEPRRFSRSWSTCRWPAQWLRIGNWRWPARTACRCWRRDRFPPGVR